MNSRLISASVASVLVLLIGAFWVRSSTLDLRNNASKSISSESSEDSFDPARHDPDYLAKVARSRLIGAYLESPLRNVPKYRGLLMDLLEHGYGVEEWAASLYFLKILHGHAGRSDIAHDPGYFEKLEIPLDPDKPESIRGYSVIPISRESHLEEVRRSLYLVTRIDDDKLLDQILNFDMSELANDAKVLGDRTISPGDSFYSDSDWLDDELIAARRRYGGKRKENYLTRIASEPLLPLAMR